MDTELYYNQAETRRWYNMELKNHIRRLLGFEAKARSSTDMLLQGIWESALG
jgi:hypothetical protein